MGNNVSDQVGNYVSVRPLQLGNYVSADILCEAERRRKDVLLITGDVKEDWWRKERGQTRGPRLELVDELRKRAGVNLFMIRPESLLDLATRLLQDLDVDRESVRDAERVDRSVSTEEYGGWTQEAVQKLLDQLASEGHVQAMAILLAAQNDGFVSRNKVYEFGGYDKSRSLRGFTRPINRIVQKLRDRGAISEDAVDVLKAVYDPRFSYVQASGFRIPQELIPLFRAAPREAQGQA
jgi:hypothetical protein